MVWKRPAAGSKKLAGGRWPNGIVRGYTVNVASPGLVILVKCPALGPNMGRGLANSMISPTVGPPNRQREDSFL